MLLSEDSTKLHVFVDRLNGSVVVFEMVFASKRKMLLQDCTCWKLSRAK